MLILLLFGIALAGGDTSAYSSIELRDNYTLTMYVDCETEALNVTLYYGTTTVTGKYVSLGFGAQMNGSDIVVCTNIASTYKCRDMHGTG